MPQFINNLTGLTVDDQYFMEVPVTQGTSNAPTGNIGLVGTFSRGPLNTPVLVTSYQQLTKQFGEVDSALALTGTLEARGIFAQGNANVYVVRIDAKATPSAAASVVIKDGQATPGTVLTLNAFTNGTWGNSLNAVVSAGTLTGTFKIQLPYGDESESWDNLVIQQPGTPIAGAVLASTVFGTGGQPGLSKLATATFPGTPNTNTPKAGTFAFTSGADGAGAVGSDYVGGNTGGAKTGLSALDSAPVNIVIAAGQSDTTTNQAVLTNANNVTQAGGLPRIGVITFPKGTPVNSLSTLVGSNYNSDRLVAVYPWVQINEPITGTTPTVSPLGYMAGLLAQLSPQKSTGNKPIAGILGADPSLIIGAQDYATMAASQINVIGVPTPAGAIGVRGGFNLNFSGDSQLYVRRMKDYTDQSVFLIGGQYVDQPITPDLMRQVYNSVDNILLPMKEPNAPADQMIADYRVICDSTNNPASSVAQNRLICDYAVKLLNMDRFMVFRTQIGAGVVITSTQQGQ